MGYRGTDFNDAIAADQQFSGTDEHAMLHIEKVGCMKHEHNVADIAPTGSG
jgi:hypothetical protein